MLPAVPRCCSCWGVLLWRGERGWPNMLLWGGVLQRIAVCYFFTASIFMFFRPRAMAAICVGLLIGYWALVAFVPFPDFRLEPAVVDRLAGEAGSDSRERSPRPSQLESAAGPGRPKSHELSRFPLPTRQSDASLLRERRSSEHSASDRDLAVRRLRGTVCCAAPCWTLGAR